jgi:L-seryl-tRNA(Ser) seleniumtransferase
MLDDKQRLLLRSIPAVHDMLKMPAIRHYLERVGHATVSAIVGESIDQLRHDIINRRLPPGDLSQAQMAEMIVSSVNQSIDRILEPSLKPVINATGVVLHTNLGRARLSKAACRAVQLAAYQYSNLELNLETGKRGSRYEHVEAILKRLTGAEAALVVNNNASAVMLTLNEMAFQKEVIVSRGQLVEIGGSFRVSEIMAQSGARLKEVGTTNKTHLYDYERNITEETALLMKVHTSNFKTIGFTQEVPIEELVALGQSRQIPVYEDLGSGVLVDLKRYGIGDEPTVQSILAAGADLVSFSGDKLLGGPQAGIIVGRKKWVDRLKKNQWTRAMRVDKMTLAALEATLRHYLTPGEAEREIPTLSMLLAGIDEIERRVRHLYQEMRRLLAPDVEISIIEAKSEVGGGSLPGVELPTFCIAIKTAEPAHRLERSLRRLPCPIMARIENEHLLFDVRTVSVEDFDSLINGLLTVLQTKSAF